MDIFLIILGSICLLVGLAGCIVPMLPGPPVSYLALVFLHFTDKVSFTKLLQKSGIRKNEVIELIYRGFI